MLHLEKVNGNNVWDILKLTVSESQKNFVATNEISIIEAYTAITGNGHAFPFGIYDEDKPEGYRLFCRAKDIGSVEAIRQVAMCLCEGYGVQKDFDRAQELFRIAADRGVASAMRCLGCTFKHGLGNVSADRKISEQWYLKAANHEDSQSQYIVGKLLEKNNPSNAVEYM